jgi:hypothetical protein
MATEDPLGATFSDMISERLIDEGFIQPNTSVRRDGVIVVDVQARIQTIDDGGPKRVRLRALIKSDDVEGDSKALIASIVADLKSQQAEMNDDGVSEISEA